MASAAFIVAVAILPAAMGQKQQTPVAQTPGKFAQAAQKIVAEGVQAKLPPHICTLLKLSEEEECPVSQRAVRTGNVVQGFDVLVNNKRDIVLFVVDETANDQTLYLTSPSGALRRLVTVKAGEGAAARITDQDKKAFADQKQFWVDRLVPAHASK